MTDQAPEGKVVRTLFSEKRVLTPFLRQIVERVAGAVISLLRNRGLANENVLAGPVDLDDGGGKVVRTLFSSRQPESPDDCD